MREFTIYVVEREGKIGGLGFSLSPDKYEIDQAQDAFIFVRGDTRIFVLVVSGNVTQEQCRQLAINFYEGRGREINFNNAARIDADAALWRKFANP